MSETMLANPERLMLEAIATALRPPPPVDYLAWAVRNIVFSKRESSEPGPYNPNRFSYFNEILRALSPDDPCRIVTLAKSAQLGGTVLANVFTCGSLEMDPGDVMYTHPTENNAEPLCFVLQSLKPPIGGLSIIFTGCAEFPLSH